MRRHYTIEEIERCASIEQAIAGIFAIFRRQGFNARVTGNILVLSAESYCVLAHQEEIAERAVKANGYHLKLKTVDDF